MSIENENFNSFRNRFLCRSCKKTLVSKQALDNHIIRCYEEKLDKYEDIIKKTEAENMKLRMYISNLENLNIQTKKLVDTIDHLSKK